MFLLSVCKHTTKETCHLFQQFDNYNMVGKFVKSNPIAWLCFIFLLCTLMTSANKSLEKKIFHRVENVIKQLVHVSACVRWDMKHLGSLESTKEARVALGYALSNSYTSFMLSKLPVCFISQWTHADIWINC